MIRFFFVLALLPLSLSAKRVEKIQAQVGSEAITSIDLKNFKSFLEKNINPPSYLQSLYPRKAMLKSSDLMLEALIVRKMILQKIPSSLKEEALKKPSGIGMLAGKEKIPRGRKMRKSELNFLKENQIIKHFLNLSLMSKISISDQDIESAYLKKYKKPLFQEFEYEFLSVFFKEEKKKSVINALKKNQNLALLASQLHLESKKSKIKSSQIKAEIKKELDKLSVSQISPIFLIGSTYYLLQLQWKSPLISQEKREQKEKIEKDLYDKAFNRELKEWIKEQKEKTFIKKQL